MATAITASACDFKVNGLCYNKNSDGNSVTVTYERATQPRYVSLSSALTIPTAVTTVGTAAFAGCTGLTKVNTTDLAAWCKISYGNAAANPLCCAKNLYLNGADVTALYNLLPQQ